MKVFIAKNKSLDITIKNGRDLQIKHNLETVKVTRNDETKEITELNFYGTKYSVNSDVEVTMLGNKYSYHINHIREDDYNTYELSCEKLTKSSIFLMPLIASTVNYNDSYYFNTYFYNAYIKFKGLEEYNDSNHLFLMYRFFVSDYFKDLETFLQTHKNFVRTYEPNKEFTVYVMEIPEIFKKDTKLILKGKYSQISQVAKTKIMTFHKAGEGSELQHILQKTELLKKQLEQHLKCNIPDDVELCSKPIIEQEIYT